VAPAWAKAEASKRAQTYRSGVANAYSLTSAEMEEIWRRERISDPFEREYYLPITEKGIVYEDYLGSAE
jgi:hypothetical protein